MDSLVKSRPNHYELLGITPAATDEEIRKAYAREISSLRPRPFGSLAQLSVAHETLRDPVKRRNYDVSIGLPDPARAAPLDGWHYTGPVRVSLPGQAVIDRPSVPKDEADPTEAAPAPQTAELSPLPEQRSAPSAEPKPDWIPTGPVPLQQRFLPREDEDATAEWRRPALIAGLIFLAVAVMGVLAGLWASRDVQSRVPEETPALVAPAEAHPVSPSPLPAATAKSPADHASSPASARRKPLPKPSESTAQRAEEVPEIPTEQVAALVAQPEEGAAALPLSNGVIARTIRSIGYSCGEVASTTAVDGSPGVFTVNCTSGHTYRATPVGGRYRFKRLAGQQ